MDYEIRHALMNILGVYTTAMDIIMDYMMATDKELQGHLRANV